jgi:iron complex transport system ATP-binding protein
MVRASPIVSFSDVSLTLGGKKVLSHVDWEVLPGENWVVIGPNGAGKTSLLSIINGYRWPSSGAVSVLGKRFGRTDIRELRMETGLVSSYLDSFFDRDEKVIDVVVSGRFGSTRMWGRPSGADLARAASLLRAVGCLGQLTKVVSELSQGERQKVAIARSLMAKPRLLVLDEPCEGLDIASREAFLDGLAPLLAKKGGPTFIEVTHRTEDIPAGFTHALLLRAGRVVDSGEIGATLTNEKLSRCLGTRVELSVMGGRYYMVAEKRGVSALRGKRGR